MCVIDTKVQVNGDHKQLQDVYSATEHALDFFKIQVASGSITKALEEPNKIALSESEAFHFFGKSEVINQVLVSGKQPWTVVGVFKDLPANTHLNIKALIASTLFEGNMGKLVCGLLNESVHQTTTKISIAA